MGGHFDAVGFGDPALGFAATRERLRAAIERGQRAAETAEYAYFQLETPEGCGLVAVTDQAGYLLNGCPYFRGTERQTIEVEQLAPWDAAEAYLGGATGTLIDRSGSPVFPIAFAVPLYATTVERPPAQSEYNIVGLGYRAVSHASESRLPHDGRPASYLQPSGLDSRLPSSRRCNVDCRGRIQHAAFLTNSLTGARLAYALLDCDEASLEIVIDVPSLSGGLAQGAFLEGSFWLVGRPVE